MQHTQHKSFGAPDEVRDFPNGHAEIISIGDGEVGRMVFEPGWRWSNDVKPIAGTASCEAPHFPSGHDAWVLGDEPVTVVDWFGASNYAKKT